MDNVKKLLVVGAYFFLIQTNAQRNCNVYKWDGDECRYQACKYLEEAPQYFQLRREFHEIHDEAIEICPEYSDAYRAKSVAYLKTGDFVSWKKYMDKAVELKPLEHLGYRGWCRFQFLRDYKGAIADLELLEKMSPEDIGYSQNGMYHLSIAKALCYKMTGNSKKAIEIIESQLNKTAYSVGLYDQYHLGILYLESGDAEKALTYFQQQSIEYDCAENAYYIAQAYKSIGKRQEYQENLEKAIEFYKKSRTMSDPYTHQVDRVYFKTINQEKLNSAEQIH